MTRAGALLIGLAASAASIGGAAPAQRYAVAAPAITPVPMGASCLPEASADVDAGAAWLLMDEAGYARAAFDRAADRDPDCALGYWGQVMAGLGLALAVASGEGSGPAMPGGAAIEAAIGRALAVPAATPFERAAAGALRAMRDRVAAPGVPAAWPARIAAYRDALCAGSASDRTVRLWCARALADAAGPYSSRETSAALAHAVELARDRPLDAGVALIVLDAAGGDRGPIVSRAVEAIAAANPPAPRPHLAVADVAVRRGDWAAAAASSARAAAVAGRPAARGRALDIELEALMQLGRRRDAYARAGAAIRLAAEPAGDDERRAAARAAARLAIADRRIDGRGLGDRTAVALGPRAAQRWEPVFVEALDAALRAWPGGDAALLARARTSLDALQALAGEGRANEVDWASAIVQAAMAASQDEHQQLLLFLTHAAALEAGPAMSALGEQLVPAREIAAELWLRTYRYDDARRDARAVLEAHPGRISPYVVLARTAARVQDPAGAAEAWKKVIELRASADADDTIRLEAQRALGLAK